MGKSKNNINTIEWYQSIFSDFEKKLNGQSKTFLHSIRKDALDTLSGINFPSTHDEEWKYTNVSEIANLQFIPASNLPKFELSRDAIKNYLFTGFDFYLMTFINGIYSAELSNVENLPNKVTVDSLANIVQKNPDLIKNYLNKYIKIENAFNAINNIYATDGYVIFIGKDVVLNKPIQILFLNGDESNLVLSSPHNIIVAEKNSQLKILNNFRSISDNKYFINSITEVFAEENAIVELYKIQNESYFAYHIEKLQGYQKKGSRFDHFNFTFGGKIVRNDINSTLDDENIETHYLGLYLANGHQHIDNHTFVDHAKPNCMSNELYKGIIDDNARGVFNGKIIVRKDAQKTNAYQQNKTVLLSKNAHIDTKPQLEIFADDVKCSHGATIGHLDDVANYYIRTRGIPDELAKSMLIRAFANDVVESIKIQPLREQLNHMIFEHLHKVEIENQ